MGGSYLRWRFGVADEISGELVMALLGEYGFEAFETIPNDGALEVQGDRIGDGSEDGTGAAKGAAKGAGIGDGNGNSQGVTANGWIRDGHTVIDAYIASEKAGINLTTDWLADLEDRILWADGPYSMPNTNWNAEWESNFEPVRLGNALGIRAPFHEPVDDVDMELVIMPRMSFGTGHHETTLLMSWWLLGASEDIVIQIGDRLVGSCTFQSTETCQNTELMDNPFPSQNFFGDGQGEWLRGSRVLDMGCGTGLLGILAGRLGAASVVGIDVEEWSAENAVENAARNAVPAEGMVAQWICGDAGVLPELTAGQGLFDLILANINRNVLLEDMRHYESALNQGGQLWLSGFYTGDHEILLREAARLGLACRGSASLNQWSTLLLTKK